MGRHTFSQFLSPQWWPLPEVDRFKADLSGRTIVVTGANQGRLGYECSLHLAWMNSSESHFLTPLAEPKDMEAAANMFERMSDEEYCKPHGVRMRRYSTTKLFSVLFTRLLGSRLPTGSPLTVSAVNPGVTHSAIHRDNHTWWLALLYLLLGRKTEMGSTPPWRRIYRA